MKKIFLLSMSFVICVTNDSNSQNLFSENFDDVNLLFSTGGWVQNNLSNPVGHEIWHNGHELLIPAFNGPDSSYAEASYRSTDSVGVGTISNWLISPSVILDNGNVISFYTSSLDNISKPDKLEIRLNTQNTTNVGSSSSSTGDFTGLLLSLNPNLHHDTAMYPQDYWGQFAISLTGLPGPVNCRIGFRYNVMFGGGGGINSSTIGIDAISVDLPVGISSIPGAGFTIYPNPVSDRIAIDFISPLSEDGMLIIYDDLGRYVTSSSVLKNQVKAIFSTAFLSKGIYSCELKTAKKLTRSRFIKN